MFAGSTITCWDGCAPILSLSTLFRKQPYEPLQRNLWRQKLSSIHPKNGRLSWDCGARPAGRTAKILQQVKPLQLLVKISTITFTCEQAHLCCSCSTILCIAPLVFWKLKRNKAYSWINQHTKTNKNAAIMLGCMLSIFIGSAVRSNKIQKNLMVKKLVIKICIKS